MTHLRNTISIIIACGLGASLTTSAAQAQSYNIDFGDARSGPSASYGAAGLPGAWNVLGVPTPGINYPLVNLQGQLTGATLNNIGGTSLLITDDPATSGDDELLMDDMLIGFNNPVDVCIWVKNIPNGPYEVLIYAMTPDNPSLMSTTRVDFAQQGPTQIGGAWPGAHQIGITHSRHTVNVTNNQIGLHSGLWNALVQSGINGIQVRPLVTGDATGDALVNVNDLLAIINTWGECSGPSCPADIAPPFEGDGQVNVNDLLLVINNWS